MTARPHALLVLTARAWLRYLVPLTLLSIIALAPIVYVAWKTGAPRDIVTARAQMRLGWMFAGVTWACQLWLVAGVMPAVHSIADREPLSQLRVLWVGLARLVKAAVPCAIAVIAIVFGGLALVVPGALLLVLLAPTGASPLLGNGPAAPLVDTIEAVRKNLKMIAILIGAIIAIDLAIVLASQTALLPTVSKKVAPSKLLPIRTYVRVVAIALVAFSPLAACALAATRSDAERG